MMSNNNVNLDVSRENKASIQNLLESINGKAATHNFNFYNQIMEIAKIAEMELEKREVEESERIGAVFEAVSGQRVAKSYRATRNANMLKLIRKKDGWAIASIEKIMIYPNQGGERKLILKKEQNDA